MSARLTGRKRRLAVAIGVVAVFAMGATAFAAIPNSDGNIYACYSNGDGSVRVQNDPAKPCSKNWSPLKWAATQPVAPTLSTYQNGTLETEVPPHGTAVATAECDDGDIATGGGFMTAPELKVRYETVSDSAQPTDWKVAMENEGAFERTFNAFVICLDATH